MSGLEKQFEQGWPLGVFSSGGVESIPAGAVEKLFDGYWPDDGEPERRGGSTYKSSSALSPAPVWIADWRLAGGQRTAFANTTELSSLDSNDTSLFSVDTSNPQVGVRPVVVHGMLAWVVDATGGTDRLWFWGGGRKATYSTGTMSVNEGDTTVNGVGTAWLANVDAGMLLNTSTFAAPINAAASDTSLALTEPWPFASQAGVAYTLVKTLSLSAPGPVGAIVALGSVAGRLLAARSGGQVYFSPIASPFATWDPTDLHSLPSVLGIGNIRDTAIIFTTEGTYAIYNMALDLTDNNGNPQQRVERINDELILWGQHGIANWQGRLIVPMLDGVWIMDTLGQPAKISSPVEDAYASYVRAGYKPGTAAIFQGRYFLPIVNSSNVPQDLLVCRLTPNSAGRSMLWSQYRGHGGWGNVRGVASRPPPSAGSAPALLAAGEDGKISTLHPFEPSSSYKDDADGVDHVLEMRTRAIPTGGNVANTVRFVTLFYTLTDAASDNPTVDCAFSLDGNVSFTAATAGGTGAETSGTVGKKTWRIDRDCRFIQFKFVTANAASNAKFRGVELQVHRTGRV